MQIKITPVRTTPEEFENGGFAPGSAENASNDFRPHFDGEFKNAIIMTGHFGFVIEVNWGKEIT